MKSHKPRRRQPAGPASAPASPSGKPCEQSAQQRLIAFLERRRLVLVCLLTLIGSLRIVSTYTVFNHTGDEPAHIACGMEWLAKGVYRWEPQHPPLARVMTAVGPFLSGIGPQGTPKLNQQSMYSEGFAILYSGNHYDRTLALARLGILPFFWIGCAVVYLWAKRYSGAPAGVMAVLLFSFLPPVLAHAGLATTDMACTAMLGAAFLTACIFIEEPSRRNAAIFGLCGGLAILSKFSVLAFFPASGAAALVWYGITERPSTRHAAQAAKTLAPLLAIAVAVAAAIVWAGYRFSFAHGVPAPELWQGIRDVEAHNAHGHVDYLLGHISRSGFWYFFPVALAVKTPLAFLVLASAGFWMVLRQRQAPRLWLAAAYATGIMAFAMTSRINIGVRHILPMYIGLAVLGGAAVCRSLSRPQTAKWMGIATPVLLLWMTISSVASHPDYLAYFNEIAGSHPENILVDSDLDWGQDMKRLGERLHAAGAHEVTFMPFTPVDFAKQPGFEGITVITGMSVASPSAGWNAVSLSLLKQRRLGYFEKYPSMPLWPEIIPPAERVGKSILLWYFPPSGNGN